jgi:hypothetical protein
MNRYIWSVMGIVIFIVAVICAVCLVYYEDHELSLAVLRTRQEFPVDGAMFFTLRTVFFL